MIKAVTKRMPLKNDAEMDQRIPILGCQSVRPAVGVDMTCEAGTVHLIAQKMNLVGFAVTTEHAQRKLSVSALQVIMAQDANTEF